MHIEAAAAGASMSDAPPLNTGGGDFQPQLTGSSGLFLIGSDSSNAPVSSWSGLPSVSSGGAALSLPYQSPALPAHNSSNGSRGAVFHSINHDAVSPQFGSAGWAAE